MTPGEIAKDWRDKAKDFEDAGQLAQARVAYAFAWKNSPAQTKLGLLYARLLIELRDRTQASRVLDQIGESFEGRTNPFYLNLRGDLERSRNNFDEAANWFQQIDQPQETYPLIMTGACRGRQGNFDAAMELYSRAASFPYQEGSTQPDEAWLNIALILRAREDLQGALEAANKALAFDPNYVAAREIVDDLTAAIELQGTELDAASHEPCLFQLYRDKCHAQALVVARKRVAECPAWIQAQVKLGDLLIEFRRFADATMHIEWLESGEYHDLLHQSLDDDEIKLHGTAEEQLIAASLELRSYLETVQGNLGIATELLNQLVERVPSNRWHAIELAECLSLQERHEEALKILRQIRDNAYAQDRWWPPEETAMMDAGLILRTMERYGQAAEIWLEGAIQFPDNLRFTELAEDALAADRLHQELFRGSAVQP